MTILWPMIALVPSLILAPSATFRRIAAEERGFGLLAWLLLVELALTRPVLWASAAMRLPSTPSASLASLIHAYLGYALTPMVIVFAVGAVLYYSLRDDPSTRVELWAGASVVAYAWIPHTLLVAFGATLAAVGLDLSVLPHRPLLADSSPGSGVLLTLVRAVIEFGPTAALGALAFVALGEKRCATSSPRPALLGAVAAAMICLLAAAGLGAAVAVKRNWSAVRPVVVGDRLAPDLRAGLARAAGTSTQGKVLLVDFWATWCPPCVEAMPALSRLQRDLDPARSLIVSINVEQESPSRVAAFVREHALAFPVHIDDGALQEAFKVTAFPTVFLIDEHSVVQSIYVGALDVGEIQIEITALLAAHDPV